MKKIIALIFALSLFSRAVFAEEVSFEAAVSENRIVLGSAAELVLTLHGSQEGQPPAITNLDGFDVRYVGPSTQVSVVNGEYSSAKAFRYMLLPLKEGKFTIPSIEITVKGQIYRTQPIVLDVVAATDSVKSAEAEQVQTLEDRIRLKVYAAKNQLYVNEEIPVSIKLYVRDVPLSDISLPELAKPGINVGSFDQPKQYEEVVDGLKFHIVEFSTKISVTRTGPLTLGPVVLNASLLYKSQQRRDPFGGGLFNDDFFQGFFNTYQKRPITISSKPVDVSAEALPDAGRPAGFTGMVGRFDMAAEVSPSEVKVGDPVTLRMAISGAGDLKAFKMPAFNFEGFKSYDPQIKDEDGRKIFEQVLIPSRVDLTEVPSVSFNYFDPEKRDYLTVTRGPFPLKVSAPALGEEFQAVGFNNPVSQGGPESFGKDIVFIKESPGRITSRGERNGQESLLVWLISGYAVAWIGLWGWYRYQVTLNKDLASVRRRRGPRLAREALKSVEKASGEDPKKVSDNVAQILHTLLRDVLSLSPGDALGVGAGRLLKDRGLREDLIGEILFVEEALDRIRFSSGAVSLSEVKEIIRRVRLIVDGLERQS